MAEAEYVAAYVLGEGNKEASCNRAGGAEFVTFFASPFLCNIAQELLFL